MEIDVVTVRCDHSQIAGWMLSARLHGASAKGWSGESGNIITRYVGPCAHWLVQYA